MYNCLRLILVTLLVFCSLGFFDVEAKTINANSCSKTDITSAYNSASNDDTILIPSGACIWSDHLTISKTVTIQGQGAGNTNLQTSSGDSIFEVAADNVVITGITFNCNYKNTGASGIVFVGTHGGCSTIGYYNWRIHDNTFQSCGASGGDTTGYAAIGIEGFSYGVIDNNTFNDCNGECIAPVSNGVNGLNRSNEFGQYTNGTVFIEDNTFNANRNVYYENAVDSNSAGRWTFRYNTINLTNGAYYGGDITSSHETCYYANGTSSCGDAGDQVQEVYGNTINLASGTSIRGISSIRSGRALVYNNTITGSGTYAFGFAISHYRSFNRDGGNCSGAVNPRGYSVMCHESLNGYTAEGRSTNKTALNGALGNDNGCPTMASIISFPTYGGSIVVGSEQIDYTAISGNTLSSCTRGANGTTRAAHSNGSSIDLLVFGQCLEQVNNVYVWGNTINTANIFDGQGDKNGYPDYTAYDIKSYAQRPNNWQYRNDGTAFSYTPYTYPHPLRVGVAPPPAKTPKSPQNPGGTVN